MKCINELQTWTGSLGRKTLATEYGYEIWDMQCMKYI